MSVRRPIPGTTLPPGTRPFRPDDAPSVRAAMQAAHDRGELPGMSRHLVEESVERVIAEPWLAIVAELGDGVAGWIVPVHHELVVAPSMRRRGVGRRLVDAGRALAAHLDLPELRLWVPRAAGPEAFAAAVGLRYRSSLWQLELSREAGDGGPAFPGGMAIRAFEPGADEPAFVDLVNDTFRDHPSPISVDVEAVRRVNAAPDFDPSTILLVAPAAEPDRLIGFCRVGRYRDDDAVMTGEVRLLGVRSEARRRGLGRALVRWGVHDLRRRGVDRIVLSVEGQNESALGIYESEGFRRRVEWRHWTAPPQAAS